MPGGSPVLKLTRSAHNLSNKTLFDVEQNTLVPTAIYDVVPGDKFNLGSSALIRTTPLIKPAFTIDLEAKSISAYCSYRTLWKPFEDFFSGGRTGNAKIPLPVFNFCNATTNNGKPYNVLDYFDLPSRSSNPGEYGGNESFFLNALYLLAYLKVWNDLFRNPTLDIEIDVYNLTIYLADSDTPYKFNPNQTVTFVYNGTSYTHVEVTRFLYWCFSLISQTARPGDLKSAALNLKDGYINSDPETGTDDGFRLMPAIVNLPRDLFTSALPTASGPNEVSLGLSGAVSNNIFKEGLYTLATIESSPTDVTPGIPIVKSNGHVTIKPAEYRDFTIYGLDRSERGIIGANTAAYSDDLYARVTANDLNLMVNKGSPLNISGIYPRELRLIFGLDLKNQIRNLTGNRYKDLTKAFYGIDIQDYRVQMAEYIGGNKYPIYTSEVLQTSESQSTPLGDQAGHQIASGVGKHGSYFVRELGCILNLFWINSSLPYTQGLRRDWCKFSINDFFFSMFEKLGDQEILQHELSFTFNPDNMSVYMPNFRIFGFTPRYSEYKFYNHTCKGGFRGNYRYWTQARFFNLGSESPVLSSKFIKPHMSTVNRIYQTVSADYTLKPYQVKFENRTIAFRPMEENTLGYLIDHF